MAAREAVARVERGKVGGRAVRVEVCVRGVGRGERGADDLLDAAVVDVDAWAEAHGSHGETGGGVTVTGGVENCFRGWCREGG